MESNKHNISEELEAIAALGSQLKHISEVVALIQKRIDENLSSIYKKAEEESKESILGSELCRHMSPSEDNMILAWISDENDETARFHKALRVINGISCKGYFCDLQGNLWNYAVPVGNNGKELSYD